MPIINRSGLNRMRTHTSRRLSENLRPHELYMKLTSLEIERARRITERDATAARLATISERIEDLERQRDLVITRIDTLNSTVKETPSPTVKMASKGHLQY